MTGLGHGVGIEVKAAVRWGWGGLDAIVGFALQLFVQANRSLSLMKKMLEQFNRSNQFGAKITPPGM